SDELVRLWTESFPEECVTVTPDTLMTTSSLAPGCDPLLQFVPSAQSPLVVLIQLTDGTVRSSRDSNRGRKARLTSRDGRRVRGVSKRRSVDSIWEAPSRGNKGHASRNKAPTRPGRKARSGPPAARGSFLEGRVPGMDLDCNAMIVPLGKSASRDF